MKRTVLVITVFFLSAAMVWAKDGDPKRAVVGVWTMGFCQANSPSPPYPYPFGCTTQLMNFHEDGSVWSSYMYDQDPAKFGGLSVGAAGNWHYLGDHRYFVTMLRFLNNPTTRKVDWLLRTDLIVEVNHMSDEAVATKMVFMYFEAIDETGYPRVVRKDPYKDQPKEIWPGPSNIPLKRVPAFVPDSPVLFP